MSQTQIQRPGAVKFGSAKVEVGDTIPTLEDLGAMRGISIAESFDKVEVESDNAGVIKEYIKNQRVAITGQLIEIDMEMLDKIRGGIDEYEAIAGTQVQDYNQVVNSGDWHYNDFIKFDEQNGDNSQLTPDSVTGSVDGALVEDTDYYVGMNERGESGLFIIDSATVTTEAQNITIVYDYTPAASKKLTSGGKKTINPKVVRLTNTDENGKKLQVTVYFASIEEGITFEFPADESEDVMVNPINLVGKVDVSRSVGDQLYEIIDEQSIE
jgi:hypothetical protein